MTIKQKFSSIDQSKLTADQKAFLTKNVTVNVQKKKCSNNLNKNHEQIEK